MSEQPMTLVRAEVTEVLGEYDHAIEFADKDNFVIIYGPNGVGKTRFLEVIHALSRLEGRKLARMPFATATLIYSNGTVLGVESSDKKSFSSVQPSWRNRQLHFVLHQLGHAAQNWNYQGEDFEDWLVDNSPWSPIDHEDLWEDSRDGELAHLVDL